MAKGLEDTAFYRYNRLTALNEVGGDPTQFGLPVAQFHRQNAERARKWPAAMLASSTHDTKRSEDVRARIAVLSEIPGEWRKAINRWARLNRKHKTRVDGVPAPDRNDEYLFYQTLLGAWPLGAGKVPDGAFVERIESYMLKAQREAQIHTSWINPNDDYEMATSHFVRRALDGSAGNPFLDDLSAAAVPDRSLRRDQRTGDAPSQVDLSRRAGPLPGNRTLGSESGRSGQPPPGRL